MRDSREEAGQLTGSLVRKLRIIAELPGRATTPLVKKRRGAEAAKLTCAQLLEIIEPLTKLLHPAVTVPVVPEMARAPDDLDLDPYLCALRWFLEDGEQLHGIVFPYEASVNNFPRKLPAAALNKLPNAAWDVSKPDKMQVLAPKVTSSTSVAVTDHRTITANLKELLHYGEPGATHLLGDMEGIHPRTDNTDYVCPVIGVTTRWSGIRQMFPAYTDQTSIDGLATMIDGLVVVATKSASGHTETQTAIVSSTTETASF